MGEGSSSTDPALEQVPPGRFTYRVCVPYMHVYSDGRLIAYYRRGLDAGSLVCLNGCFLHHGVRPVGVSAAATTANAAERKIRRLIREMAQGDVSA